MPDAFRNHDYAASIRRKSITCIPSDFTKPNPPPALAFAISRSNIPCVTRRTFVSLDLSPCENDQPKA